MFSLNFLNLTELNMNPTALTPNQPFCVMASPDLQTTTTTGFVSGSAFD
jgi:hypothetical protein